MFKKLSFLAIALVASQAAMAQYKVIDLTPSAANLQLPPGQDGWAEGYGNAGGVQVGAAIFRQAAMWLSSSPSMILLLPGVYSEAFGTDGVQQVGFANDPARAALWSGSAASFVDLHPANYIASVAYACSAGIQSGWGLTPPTVQGFPFISDDDNRFSVVQGGSHALKWSGTAASVVDLNPANFDASISWGTENGVQVGSGVSSDDGVTRALRWLGTPESYVDISPATDWPNGASVAYAIHNGQTGGYSTVYGSKHATIWNGPTSADAVDVHPPAFYESIIKGTNGRSQVGFGMTGVGALFGMLFQHAIVWNGTADSAVDLHQFLPQGWENSVAQSIGDDGTILVTAFDYQPGNQTTTNGGLFNGGTGVTHAYLLVPSDTPACAVASVSVDRDVEAVTVSSITQLVFPIPITGTVTLTSPAPAGGAVVRLLNLIYQGRETSVTVPEGQTSATFLASDPLLAYPCSTNCEQPISASYGGITKFTHYTTLGPDQNLIFSGPIRPNMGGIIQLQTPLDADELVTVGSDHPNIIQTPPQILLKKGMAYFYFPYNITPDLNTNIVSFGGTCSRGNFSVTTVVHPFSRPIATLTSISPSTAASGQPFTMTLTGLFAPGAQVLFSGVPVPTHQLSSTTLTADIPASATPIDTAYPVSVQNPKAFPSAALNLKASGPTLGSVTPSTVTLNTTVTATLSGTNFAPGAVLMISTFNSDPIVVPTTWISAKQLTAVIPGSAIWSTAPLPVWVRNPNSFADTVAVNLSVQFPKPVISSLSPSTVAVGSPDTTITVTGTGFTNNTLATFGGKSMTVTYVSQTQIKVLIPAIALSKKTTSSVNVSNPSPGGGGSNGVNLIVN